MDRSFSEQEHLFLETVCAYFHENGNWPTYDNVERALLDHEDFDVVEIVKGLDAFLYDGLHVPFSEWDMEHAVYISLGALYTCQVEGICPRLKDDFDAFMKVVQVCVEKYRTMRGKARVTSRDVTNFIEPTAAMHRKVFLLATLSGITNGSSYSDGTNGEEVYFDFGVPRAIRHYRNAETIEDFVSIREGLLAKDRQAQPPSYADILANVQASASASRALEPISLLPTGPFTVIETSCFVLMPFKEALRPVYDKAIVPAATRLGLECRRADEIFKPGGIMAQVWQCLMEARIVIADLTGMNANVFYELGLAHVIGHDVIMLTQDMSFVPFDLRHLRCFEYRQSESGLRLLEQNLRSIIRKVLDEPMSGSA